jgi:uncharacterized protein
MNKNALRKAENLHIDNLGHHTLIFNPMTENGVILLNKEAYSIFKLIDGKKTQNDLFNILKKNDSNFKKSNLKEMLTNFKENKIIKKGEETPINFPESKSIGVWMQLTNKCNLACPYCYISKNEIKMPLEIGIKAIEKIFDSAKINGIKKINLKFAGGEPSLESKNMFFLANYAKKLSKKHKINCRNVMITNGTLLTGNLVKKLKKHNFHIAISIDGLEKSHDLTRKYKNGKGSYKQVISGLNKLNENKIDFNVSIVINSYNLKELPQLTDYFLKKDIHFTFNFIRDNPLINDSNLIPTNIELIKSLKKVYSIIKKNIPKYPIMNSILDKVQFKPKFMPCGAGTKYIVVSVDGKLSNCQVLMKKPVSDINQFNVLSQLKNKSILPNKPIIDETPICKDCKWRYICSSGCPILREKTYGSYKSISPYCQVYKNLIPEVLKLEGQRIMEGVKI